jgi:hypothetical protein
MSTSLDRLVYMANQIGKFFESQGAGKVAPGIADHIRKILGPADEESHLCASRRRRRRA